MSVTPWRIAQLNGTAVLFGNFLDDCKAQPGPLFAGRHIGFDKPVPALLGKAPTVVDYLDCEPSRSWLLPAQQHFR